MLELINFDVLGIYLAMVALVNAVVEALVKPITDHFEVPGIILMYVSWAVSAVVIFMTGLNIFASVIPPPLAGQVLTALVVGRGANFLHDLMDKA